MSDQHPGAPSDDPNRPPTGPTPGWTPPPVGAGQPGGGHPGGYPQGYYPPRQRHPQATLALVLGILGIVACGVVAPFAWWIGSKAQKEIDANPFAWDGRSEVQTGKILGIVGTVLLILTILFFLVYLIIFVVAIGASSSGTFSLVGTLR